MLAANPAICKASSEKNHVILLAETTTKWLPVSKDGSRVYIYHLWCNRTQKMEKLGDSNIEGLSKPKIQKLDLQDADGKLDCPAQLFSGAGARLTCPEIAHQLINQGLQMKFPRVAIKCP